MSHLRFDGRKPPISERGVLSDTSVTTLYTAEGAILGASLVKLHLCNRNAGAVDCTVDIHDGTTAFIWTVTTVAIDGDTDIELDTVIRSGESVRLTGDSDVNWHLEVGELLRDTQGGR